jgi:hypothetical protein
MRVLYIASNPDEESSLALQREITEFQKRAVASSGDNVEFVFLPNLPFEELPTQISRHKPDVLHISAHGEHDWLAMSQGKKMVRLTAEILNVFLDVNPSPKLAYLNACHSDVIAKELTRKIPVAIGTTAAITNHVARSAAVNFYIGLLEGKSVTRAFEVGRVIMRGLGDEAVDSKLFSRDGLNPSMMILHQPSRIVASFLDDEFKPMRNGHFQIMLGVIGCPKNTNQMVFFTDDETFITTGKNLASDLCSIIRTTPDNGVLWLDHPLEMYGDCRWFACGTSAAGDHFSIASSVCAALEEHYVSTLGLADPVNLPGYMQNAITELRRASLLHEPPKKRLRRAIDPGVR